MDQRVIVLILCEMSNKEDCSSFSRKSTILENFEYYTKLTLLLMNKPRIALFLFYTIRLR